MGQPYCVVADAGGEEAGNKRKWSLSNLMTAVYILLNSYINLYDFLNLPEGQWLKIIKNRNLEDDISPQLELFPQTGGLILRITRLMSIYRHLVNRINQFPIFIGQQKFLTDYKLDFGVIFLQFRERYGVGATEAVAWVAGEGFVAENIGILNGCTSAKEDGSQVFNDVRIGEFH